MNPATADFWNARYARDDYIFGTAPNQFLASQLDLIKPAMRILAVADGEGRNSVWLAQQKAQVHAVEVSPVALDKARALARNCGVTVQYEEADLLNWRWPEAEYDLVVAIFIQFASPDQRVPVIAGIRRALKPGGVLILQGYTPKQVEFATGGPSSVENMYTESLLHEWFGDWRISHLREHEDVLREGTHHHGLSALIDLIAHKPG